MIPAILYHTPTGSYWLPNTPNCGICKRIIAGFIYDEMVFDALRPYIRSGSTVVDLGACFGQMTVQFARLVGDNGTVVAVEANPDVFEIMTRNINENGLSNVYTANVVAWDRGKQPMKFPIPDMSDSLYPCYGCWGMTMESPLGYHEVNSMALDDLELKDVSAIKVDVQGADLFALLGSVQTIRRCQPVMVFEYEDKFAVKLAHTWLDYVKFVKSIGYTMKRLSVSNDYVAVPA